MDGAVFGKNGQVLHVPENAGLLQWLQCVLPDNKAHYDRALQQPKLLLLARHPARNFPV